MRLLIADPDVQSRMNLEQMLKTAGHSVVSVADGISAVETIQKHLPDLVLSTVSLPELDGFDLLQVLRSDPRWNLLPVVLVAARSSLDDLKRGMALGADDVMLPPYDPQDVLRTVTVRLDRTRRIRSKIDRQRTFIKRYLPHELRTPLSAILGYADLMVDIGESGKALSLPETLEYGRCLQESGLRLLESVENITLWEALESKVQQGLSTPLKTWSTEKAGLRETLQRLARGHRRPEDMVVNLAPALLHLVTEDAPRVVGMLVDNAFKFSPRGSLVEVLGFVRGRSYELRVKDRGTGMSAEAIRNIDAFSQFNREKLEQQGLGLGLTIVQLFTLLSGGSFEIKPNDEGTGLTVCLSFNLADPQDSEIARILTPEEARLERFRSFPSSPRQ